MGSVVLVCFQMFQSGAAEPVVGMLAGVKTRKDRAIPGYLLCRTFLLCFFCLPLCFLNQWELVLPDISLSGIWIILYSAFFSCKSSCSCLDLTTIGNPPYHIWPLQWEGISKLPPSVLCIFANVLFKTANQIQVPSSH